MSVARVSAALGDHYRRYLDALNERRFDDLADFVAARLTYNGRPMTLGDYQQARRDDVETIPDLRFEIGLLVVEGEQLTGQVACRIEFDCTPERSFAGCQPTGRRIRFDEHVFYRFESGLITEVRSLIDLDAVRAQLAGGSCPQTRRARVARCRSAR